MDKDISRKYSEQLEVLLDSMLDPNGFELQKIYAPLAEICKLFRLCRGVTKVFRSPEEEKAGQGEEFVCYDNGCEGELAYHRRQVSASMTVAECNIYMPKGERPLDDEERRKVDVVVRALLSFVARNRLETMNEKLTYTDQNGYPNTNAFMRFISRRDEDGTLSRYAAIRFNLRHFSLVNQEIGRRFGDIVIRKYFDMLVDAVGETGIVCRIGGDNFTILVNKELISGVITILKGTPIVYDNIRTKRVMVIADAGVFVIPDGFVRSDNDDIMDKLVAAVQEAKTGGRDSIVFFDNRIVVNKEKMMRIQQQFPKAIETMEYKVFYQPKVNIATGELVGAEALCRWFHDGKIVPPMDFIPVLERTPQICALDFYMLNMVCKDIRRWLDEGRDAVRISVNLSRKHMMDIDLLERITGIIRINNVPSEYIEIELTETTTDVEFRDLKRVVSGLQQEGVYTSVDDFGMGYSSLNLIREIPWNVLKVDRSFLPVEGDNSVSNRSIMFKYVVAMAKEMGLECIAEGVETKRQIDVLRANRCEFAQGFFFDRPLPVDEFEKRLDVHRYNVEDGTLAE